MSADRISLSLQSKKYVLKLCKRIQEKAPNNKMAIRMSMAMADVARKYGHLSSKQIGWLINNARIHKIKLLPELAELLSNSRGQQKANGDSTSNQVSDGFERKVLRRLSRIEKIVRELHAE